MDSSHQQRNERWLRAYAASRSERRRLQWRNALVGGNLALVRQVAARVGARNGLLFDDLTQVGCLGLIRAIECFDAKRGGSLSSFAVPYIRGAIAHELRDRGALMRIPRPLWELRQRAHALQERRRALGQEPLAEGELARALGCPRAQLVEALALARVSEMRSLDAPLAERAEGQGGTCLLDLLAAPPQPLEGEEGPRDGLAAAGDSEGDEARLRWLRRRMARLEPELRTLLTGRLVLGCTWVELGQKLGIHPRMAQRRCDATLARLRQEAAEACDAGAADPPPP